MSEHSQLNERLWECNLQENGINLGHTTTKSANNDQSINDISVSSFYSTTFDHPIII
ncbi:hypothetical protein Hanom_Chr04g00284871 [Helianthus anomalus]